MSWRRSAEGYLDLDVAIYGCGDGVDDGWLSEVMRHVNVDPRSTPATDVCLNLLTADGQPIPLPAASLPDPCACAADDLRAGPGSGLRGCDFLRYRAQAPIS